MKHAANGGFPEPPAGEPVRLLRARHEACGTDTRVRLPKDLPARVVRRVVCDRCDEPFEAQGIEEIAAEADGARPSRAAPGGLRLRRPRLPQALHDPRSHAWRYGGIIVAAAAVIGALLLINGSSEPASPEGTAEAPAVGAPTAPGQAGGASARAKLVHGANFSLALPAGWKAGNPPAGAAYSARASDGGADVTLWIERDASLDFADFETQSLEQLNALAGSARVVARVPGPTPDATIVTLAAATPSNQPQYEVTLRASGPYRYYLATTVEPGASTTDAAGVELIHNSFVPTAAGGDTGAGD